MDGNAFKDLLNGFGSLFKTLIVSVVILFILLIVMIVLYLTKGDPEKNKLPKPPPEKVHGSGMEF